MPEVLVPILRLYFVPALAYVVAQALAAAFAVKLIYRDCRFEGESLSLRVGPEVVRGAAHAKRSRCYQREQFVLVLLCLGALPLLYPAAPPSVFACGKYTAPAVALVREMIGHLQTQKGRVKIPAR